MSFKNLTTSMGLSHGDVTCICQDHDGYIWIGTADGLNKYDGVGFTIFKNIKNDTTSLSTSYINCIYEDKQNNLWIGSPEGLSRYNRDENNFERISLIDNHNNKFSNSVMAIFEDNSNNLWIGCRYGVFLFNRENKKVTEFFADSFHLNTLNGCTGICQDKNGVLWFSFQTSNDIGIIKYNAATNKIIRYSTQDRVYKLKENHVSCLMADNLNNIWIGYYSSGIDILNGQTNTITGDEYNNNSFGHNIISSIVQKENGKIYIGTDGSGISIFDPDTKSFHQYASSESNNSLLSNAITNIYVSREGIVWIGCWGGGVSIYDKHFESFIHYKQDKNSLQGSSVTCFTEDLYGNIWIATDGGGINMFNPLTKKFTNYRNDSKNPYTLTNNKVLALETDNKGGLWAGMWKGGLNYFKIAGEKLILKKKYNLVDENYPNSNSIFKIYFSKEKELWVGNFETGAYKFDPSTEKFKSVKLSKTTINYNSIRDITCDSYNNIWFASEVLGLIKINLKSGESESFIHDEKDSTSLTNISVNVIFEDSKKRLWIGCDGSGLHLFDRKTKSFTHYTTAQGLPDNSIVGILEDEHGNLWISSRGGISKATIDSTNSTNGKLNLTFRNYTVQDGLQGKVFNRWAYFKSRTGEMYFGGLNGFNVFQPDSIKDNSFIPPVHITDFILFNKPVTIGAKGSPLQKHISQTKKLVLNYDQSIFTFKFIALNYIFSEKNQYAYIMEGLEKGWNYLGNNRNATYMNLDPGEYTFRVKASNNDGIWNEEGTTVQITITPPWWQTLWFRLILLAVLTGVVYWIYKWRMQVRELAAQRRMDTALTKERNLLRTLIDLIPDYIYLKDTESRFILANKEIIQSFGKETIDEIYGKTDFDFHPLENARTYFADEQEIIRSGRPLYSKEEPVVEATGQRKWNISTKVPFRDLQGKVVGLVGIGRDITARKQIEEDRDRLITELQDALADVKLLSGLVPICANCKKIRDDQGYWTQIESYIQDRSDAKFSHSICPDCAAKLYPNYNIKKSV
jgi:PAS domain S-box-containing protein